MEDKQQVQPMKHESVNALNMDAAQIVKTNEQHSDWHEQILKWCHNKFMSKIHVCSWGRGTIIFTLDTNTMPNEGALIEVFLYKRR